jgi:hypothetical protein
MAGHRYGVRMGDGVAAHDSRDRAVRVGPGPSVLLCREAIAVLDAEGVRGVQRPRLPN